MSKKIQVKELKEPLMSQGTQKKYKTGLLKSLLKDKYSSMFQSQKVEDDQNKEEQNKEEESPAPDYQPIYTPTDYASQAKDLLNNVGQGKEHLSNFYHQATAVHEIPALTIMDVKICETDPTIFVTITKGSSFFKEMNLKEYITFGSYKLLTRIRARNYIQVLQLINQIDSSIYQEVKTKLYQIKALLKFVDLEYQYRKLYDKLDNDQQILDFEFDEESQDSEDIEKKSQKSKENKLEEDQEGDKEGQEDGDEDEDDDEYYDEEDEDEDEEHDDYKEYKDHFEVNDGWNDTSINYELMAEEEKWEVRAEWLESIIARFKKDDHLMNYVPWINSRLQSLQELDVPFKKLPDQELDQIFYLFNALEEEITREGSREEYQNEDKIYIETNEFYPKVTSGIRNLNNDIGYPAISKIVSLREKLCSRISQRERQTDFFITVYKRKQFGNEKIYEKRINVRGKDFQLEENPELDQNGNYLFLKLKFNACQSNEDIVSMLFNLKAQDKDPIFLKSKDQHMFFYDKFYYQFHKQIGKKKIEKAKSEGHNAESEDEIGLEGFFDEAENFPENKEEDKEAEEEEDFEEITQYQIYEYDLSELGKVKIYDLSCLDKQEDIESEVVYNKQFGRYKEGLYYVRIKMDNADKYHQYEITIKGIKFITDVNEKYEDYKSKKLVKEADLKYIEDYFSFRNVDYKVIKDGPTDFIFMLKQKLGSNDEVFVFRNEVFWMKDSQQKGEKEYKQINFQHEIINVQQVLSFPYLCFLYNHDQVYMKDLTKETKQGYYYMNSYLGIGNQLRPLTVFCHVYRSMINLTVPTINRNYTPSDFCIRMFQTKTRHKTTEVYKFEHRARFSIWMFNQEIIETLGAYIDTVGNKTNKLNEDVRIYSKHNALNIERWEENKVQQRIIYTHYHQSNDEYDFLNEDNFAMEYKPKTYWLLIVQTHGSVKAYTRELDYIIDYDDLATLESVLEYQDSDSANTIYSVIVDTIQREKVELYIVFQDGLMKRFTSQNKQEQMLSFQEHPNSYSLKKAFREEDQLFRQDYHKLLNYSWCFNEAKIGVCIQDTHSNNLKIRYLVTSMINIRQLPLFHHKRFIHPVVPIVDERIGFSSVLTMTLNRCYPCDHEHAYMNHDNQRKRLYNRLHNNNPGFIIKYFNGIEHHLPFTAFGEEYTEIIRFIQSRDGKYAVILGERKGKLEDRFYISQQIERQLNRGIFLYEIGTTDVKLIRAYLFAEKDPKKISEDMKKKLSLQVKKNKKFIEPELKRRTLGEYGGDYIPNDAACMPQEYEQTIDPMNYDYEYVDMIKEQQEMRKLKVLSKRKTLKTLNQNRQNNRLLEIDEESDDGKSLEDEIEALPQLQQIQDLVCIFNNFDIPYLEQDDEIWRTIADTELNQRLILETKNIMNETEVKEEQTNKPFKTEEDKRRAYLFTIDERDFIQKIHNNMIVDVNDQGHTFLINRLSNRLYFLYGFYGEPRLIKLRFDPDKFIIKGADSTFDQISQKQYLVIWSEKSYKIFDITQPLNQSNQIIQYNQEDLSIVFDSDNEDQVTENKRKTIGYDEYTYEIKQCFITGTSVILHIQDNLSTYLKIFEFKKNYVVNFIEGKKFKISGCKNFLWIMEDQNEQVIDIKNDLATFFIWPATSIENMMFHSLDLFNVCENRVYMITQGFIYLAFDYISQRIQNIIENERGFAKALQQISFSTTIANNYNYLYFKFDVKRSFFEQAYQIEYDEIPDYQEQNAENQIGALLNFFQNTFDIKQHNVNHISNFFLTFYQTYKENDSKSVKNINLLQRLMLGGKKRLGMTEEILYYLIKGQNKYILQNIINKSFVDFLDFADTSVSFQTYLKNVIVQTTLMKDTEKFQTLIPDTGYIVDSYQSPIMDNNFIMKFKKIDQPKKNVEFKYIKLGNLLAEKGEQLMVKLSKRKYLDLMAMPYFQFIVNYQWKQVQQSILWKLVYPFFLLLALFTLWAISDFTKFQDIPGEDQQYPYGQFISRILVLPLLCTISYFFYIEGQQIMSCGFGKYFGSVYNFADLISYSLCLIVVLADQQAPYITDQNGVVIGRSNSFSRPLCSLTLIILWVKLFYYLRVFDTTSKLIRMIIEIIIDMSQFLLILAIGVVAFACGFFVMQQGVTDRVGYYEVGGDLPDDPWKSFLYSYRLANGDFDYGFFGQIDNVFEYYLIWILWIIGTMFLIIVLLNLLIAIMGDTFGKVLEVLTKFTVMEKVKVIAENENLYDRAQLFKQAQYLIIIGDKGFSRGEEEINTLREDVLGIVQTLKKEISLIQENQTQFNKTFAEERNAQMKSIAQIQDKIEGLKDDFLIDKDRNINQFKSLREAMEDMQRDSKTQFEYLCKHLKIQHGQGNFGKEK